MKVLDLFSGVGMFAYGMQKAGHEVVAFCEIEEWPRKVLSKNYPGIKQYNDVRELNRATLESDGITGIEIITGGWPCQDLSLAGKQAGIYEGARSGLWSECARLVGELRPKYAIFENVGALLSGGDMVDTATGPVFRTWFGRVLRDLAEIGYDAEWHCIPASSAGAPHLRDRVWIVAYPEGGRPQGLLQQSRIPQAAGRQEPRPVERSSRPGEQQRISVANMGLLAPGIAAGLSGSRWLPEPGIRRVATGIPDRNEKLKALGNGLVWQIPYAIGCAINEEEMPW